METYIAIIGLQITYDAENVVAPLGQGPGYVSGVANVDTFVMVGHGVLMYVQRSGLKRHCGVEMRQTWNRCRAAWQSGDRHK
jgi:hypothetical protein